MEKTKNLRVSEDCWERVKLAAVKERVTMREWVERAVGVYEATFARVTPQPPFTDATRDLGIIRHQAPEKHWTPDD